MLLRLMTTKGVLFVGPSETGLLLSHEFVSAKVPLAFAFHKVAAVPTPTAPRPAGRDEHHSYLHLHNPPQPRFLKLATGFQGRPRQIQAPADPNIKPGAGIDEATMLADQGRLVEAEKSCQEHMDRLGASAQALCLMGLLRDAGGNLAEAARYYRKALRRGISSRRAARRAIALKARKCVAKQLGCQGAPIPFSRCVESV